MVQLKLSTKARTLADLSLCVTKSEILPVYIFSAVNYLDNKELIIKEIQGHFKENIIIRSSSSGEDNMQTSNAGGFESILSVNIDSVKEIHSAICKVLESYINLSHEDEVFVQPMLRDVSMCGVVFSADLDTLSPYYVINYDESGSTSSVTGGEHNDLKTYIHFKEYDGIEDNKIKQIIDAVKECEALFCNEFLDIEFAFVGETLFLLQVRPIVQVNKEILSHINLATGLRKLQKKINKLNAKHPNLLGRRTIFGIMPDWNPAEIIGIRPKRLALSLYKELITDETWAYQRDNYGYRNLRSHPLLVSFLGVPFIDVRVSFNSFIPKDLNDKIAEKLVDYYLDELAQNVNHHDKVEFEIVYSCFYFGIWKDLEKLRDKDFEDAEIEAIKISLLKVTNGVIDTNNGLYKQDLQKIEVLKAKFVAITDSNLSLIDKIYWLIKDVKRYGTLPFAGVARAGFIAVQILRSLVSENILTQKEYDSFLNSLNTVSKALVDDRCNMDKEKFLVKYGHLRPGTYDITSQRYDEAYDVYFSSNPMNDSASKAFQFSEEQQSLITNKIRESGLNIDFNGLVSFIRDAIEGREYAKFNFTKHLSQILIYIQEFGSKFGYSREDLAFLDIQKIINLYSTLDHRDVEEIISLDITKNKDFYNYTKSVRLPAVIVQQDDVYSFYLEKNKANFITLKSINSEVVLEKDIPNTSVKNKIVCIKSADPGYDYLFSKNIAGLITCYGGANSHMAIRCAELSIPAVIGCGEADFTKYSKAKVLEIDSANKNVKVLSS